MLKKYLPKHYEIPKDHKTIYDLFERRLFLFEKAHTSDAYDMCISEISAMIYARMHSYGTYPFYSGWVFNEHNKTSQWFYKENNYSGKHHKIMIYLSEKASNVFIARAVRGKDMVGIFDKFYDDNEDLCIILNRIYFNVGAPFNVEWIETEISHELTHIMQMCAGGRNSFTDEHSKLSIYLDYSGLSNYFKSKDDTKNNPAYSDFYAIDNFLYYFSMAEYRARLKAVENVLKQFATVNNNEIIDMLHDNIKNKDEIIDKDYLIYFIAKNPKIMFASKLNKVRNEFRRIYYGTDIHAQRRLFFIGHYLVYHKLLKTNKNVCDLSMRHIVEIIDNECTKILDDAEYAMNVFSAEVQEVGDLIMFNIKRIFCNIEWEIANKIDEYLYKIFSVDKNVPKDQLVHTVLRREFRLTESQVKLLVLLKRNGMRNAEVIKYLLESGTSCDDEYELLFEYVTTRRG